MKSLPLTIVCLLMLLTLPAFAEEEAPPPEQPAPPPEQQAEDAPAPETPPTDEDEKILQDLLRRRAKDKPIEPKRDGDTSDDTEDDSDIPRASGPRGTAPDAIREEPTPREEGGFVLARRGRLIRVEGGPTPFAIAFNADSSGLGDAPLYLMPSTQLETMEADAEKIGEDTTFIVSGEVFTYRGKTFLLPRLARPATDRGNLQP